MAPTGAGLFLGADIMRIAKPMVLSLAVMALAWGSSGAGAEEPLQPAEEGLLLEPGAVDPSVLEGQSGTVPDSGTAGLAGLTGAAEGATPMDQPSFAASGATVSGGLVSSSSLQASTVGGAVSVSGQ
jgi:hypothetical protein